VQLVLRHQSRQRRTQCVWFGFVAKTGHSLVCWQGRPAFQTRWYEFQRSWIPLTVNDLNHSLNQQSEACSSDAGHKPDLLIIQDKGSSAATPTTPGGLTSSSVSMLSRTFSQAEWSTWLSLCSILEGQLPGPILPQLRTLLQDSFPNSVPIPAKGLFATMTSSIARLRRSGSLATKNGSRSQNRARRRKQT
jgi:hypothetical protein